MTVSASSSHAELGAGLVIVPEQYERNAMAKRSAEGIPVAVGTNDLARAPFPHPPSLPLLFCTGRR